MYGLDKLNKFIGMMVKDPVEVEAGQCSRSLSPDSNCDKCTKACHKELISFDPVLTVDTVECDGCGFCAMACPNGVFGLNQPSSFDIISQLKIMTDGHGILNITCSDKLKGKLPAGSIALKCIGRLNEGVLLAAAAIGFKSIHIDIAGCDKCEKFRPELIAEMVKTAESLAGSLLDISSGEAQGVPDNGEKPVTEVSGENGEDSSITVSRRGFFNYLKTATVSTTAEVISRSLPNFHEEEKGLKKRLPERRSLVMQTLKILGLKNKGYERPGYFYDVEISENCAVCDFCSDFCPTGALEKSTRDASTKIDFVTYRCTACNVCSDVCPSKVVSVHPLKNGSAFTKKTLINAHIRKCARCGLDFAAKDGADKCIFCKKKEALFN